MAYAKYIIIHKEKINKVKVSGSYRKRDMGNVRLIHFDGHRRVVKDGAIYYDLILNDGVYFYGDDVDTEKEIEVLSYKSFERFLGFLFSLIAIVIWTYLFLQL